MLNFHSYFSQGGSTKILFCHHLLILMFFPILNELVLLPVPWKSGYKHSIKYIILCWIGKRSQVWINNANDKNIHFKIWNSSMLIPNLYAFLSIHEKLWSLFLLFFFLPSVTENWGFSVFKKKTQKHGHIEGAINNSLSETETCSLRVIFLIALLILFWRFFDLTPYKTFFFSIYSTNSLLLDGENPLSFLLSVSC